MQIFFERAKEQYPGVDLMILGIGGVSLLIGLSLKVFKDGEDQSWQDIGMDLLMETVGLVIAMYCG